MIRIILAFLISISFAHAKEITVISNGSVSGILSQLMQEYGKEFIDYDLKIKYTNSNCALSKSLWDSSNIPTLYFFSTGIDGSTDKNNPFCYFKVDNTNLLFITYSAPIELCSVGSKKWEDFIKAGSTHIVGITATATNAPEIFLSQLSNYYKTNLKLVRINTNAEFMTLAKAGELDFGFRTGLSGIDFFKDKCYWNAADIDSKNLFPFLKEYSSVYNALYEDSLIIHKNLTAEQVVDFRNRFQRAWKTDASKTLRSRRGYDDSRVIYSSEEERIKVFNKFLEKF